MNNQTSDAIVIVGAARTPMGSFQGDFSALAAHDLGGAAIRAAVARAGVSPERVSEVLFGNCLMAGQGQAPARPLTVTGVISAANAPDVVAALARCTDAVAKASWASRVNWYFAAHSSPKVPMARPGS